MKIKFKNGSELKVISSDVNTRPAETLTYYQKYPIDFVKDLFPDVWNNLYWYQKAFVSSVIKPQNLKERFVTLIPKQRVCINCGKNFKGRNHYYKPRRGSGKTVTEMAGFTRTMCCSDRCFNEYWNKIWNEV